MRVIGLSVSFYNRGKCPKYIYKKIVSNYDQEIPPSQTADKPMAPRGRATQQSGDTTPGRQTMQSNQLSLPHQGDCETRRDIK